MWDDGGRRLKAQARPHIAREHEENVECQLWVGVALSPPGKHAYMIKYEDQEEEKRPK